MHDCACLPCPAFGPLRLRDRGSYQLPNTGRFQIRRLRDADVANQFALAAQQAVRIGQHRAKIKADVDPIGVRRGEDERIARSGRKGEVVGDGLHLVDELAGLRSLFEDQFSRSQGELSNHFARRREESEILGIGWTQAHRASVAYKCDRQATSPPAPQATLVPACRGTDNPPRARF
jgi:hypothetical protein